MSPLTSLKAATSLQNVADILGFKAKSLAFILYKKQPAEKYTKFNIPKRSGGVRPISAPYPALMLLQSRLSDLLQNCIFEINQTRKIESALSHGFRRKYSIITNASVHRRKRYVFNIDLENFFGTINFGRVRGFFIKNRNFELTAKVATILAQIACHENMLPQGSPCSPVLSNLIGHILDIRLAALAQEVGCNYSRYADDLTFSTNKAIFPAELAQRVDGIEHNWQAGAPLKQIVSKSGFTINTGKTRMQYSASRQDVTGLVVNTKVNTRSEYRRTARAMVHRLLKTGKFQMKQIGRDEEQNIVVTEVEGTLDQLNGILSFVHAVDIYNKGRLPKPPSKVEARELVYRDFLFYRHFYAAPAPVIVCEGKTDNIYIKAAIRRLVDLYPRLAQRNKNGSISLRIRIFRYTDTTRLILNLSGGTGDLSPFIQQYPHACKKIKASGKQYPVILLIDNDDGASSIYNIVRTVSKAAVKPNGSDSYYPVSHNLYVVPTPLNGKTKSMIEDCFDANVLKTKINGKSFNPSNDRIDRKTEYGKSVFAERVVKKNQNAIAFQGFKPLLERIDAVLVAHSKSQTQAGTV
jgi:RNA-directed DNA polymerase